MDGSVYVRGYPAGQPAAALARAVAAVCPSDGVSVGRWDARETWRLDAKPEATEAEIAAARAVMAAFDPWGYGDDLGALGAAQDEEDPGEQPEIFTEEDVEALGAVAVEGEASEDAADDAGSAENASSPPVEDTANVSEDRQPAYPGVALLPDELGARRNAVLAAIATEKLTRLSIAMDPSRADFLAARFADYQNAGALGLPIDDALAADYRAFQEMRDRRDRITNYAMQLEQSALDGDMDRLSAMHAGLGDGWP